MRKFINAAILSVLAMATVALGQADPATYRVFDAKGNETSLEKIIEAAGGVDAVFLGEGHDDAVAHALQFQIFKAIVGRYNGPRSVALSYEMFERDVQIVVDEYLRGQINEVQFLASSRPWNNYKTDYRPLLEFAKEQKLPVVAANAPRRYVNMVSRLGRSSLMGLTDDAKEWLPPLPYPQPSEKYAAKFKALMGNGPEIKAGLTNIVDSQALWDAAMAHAVARQLKHSRKGLVVHLNGSFHTESRMGTAEQLISYRKKARFIVITIRYEDDFTKFDKAKHEDLGDFVILTDKKVPRSFTRPGA